MRLGKQGRGRAVRTEEASGPSSSWSRPHTPAPIINCTCSLATIFSKRHMYSSGQQFQYTLRKASQVQSMSDIYSLHSKYTLRSHLSTSLGVSFYKNPLTAEHHCNNILFGNIVTLSPYLLFCCSTTAPFLNPMVSQQSLVPFHPSEPQSRQKRAISAQPTTCSNSHLYPSITASGDLLCGARITRVFLVSRSRHISGRILKYCRRPGELSRKQAPSF
jgi:hypothetical protein